jgi:hypothetical protein
MKKGSVGGENGDFGEPQHILLPKRPSSKITDAG